MRFEWDEAKNRINRRRHRIDLGDVSRVFRSPMVVDLDDREDYGEERWVGIGWLHAILIVVVWTEPQAGTIRLISARKANDRERRHYEKSISH